MWQRILVPLLIGLAAATAFAQPAKEPAPAMQIVGVRVPALDLFDGPQGKRIETLPTERVPLPLPVLAVEPNKRLRVRLPDGRVVWVEARYVRTDGDAATQKTPGCEPAPSQKVTALSTRGLGEGCK